MNAQSSLLERIQSRKAKIGIVGLGYVGLPLGLAFADAGYSVTGIDVDVKKIDSLIKGESYIRHIPSDRVRQSVSSGRLQATTDFAVSKDLDCLIVCVPTPLTASREPDLSFIIQTGKALAPGVRDGQLYVLESTTYPGTTQEVLLPLLETNGKRAGKDFLLAFSPEREDPGNAHFNTKTIPKIVGTKPERIIEEAKKILEGHGKKGRVPEYWDGKSSDRIAAIYERTLGVPH